METSGLEKFSKASRLTSGFEFRATLRKGRVRRSGHLRVAVSDNPLGTSRIGISIGRKVCNAVVRNRLKRLLREIFRKDSALRKASWDVVVVIDKYDGKMGFSDLQNNFNNLITELV